MNFEGRLKRTPPVCPKLPWKTVILAQFEATLLETKHMACEIINKRLLNAKYKES